MDPRAGLRRRECCDQCPGSAAYSPDHAEKYSIVNKLGLRAYSRFLKVGRTITDLAGAEASKLPTSPRRFSTEAWIGECNRQCELIRLSQDYEGVRYRRKGTQLNVNRRIQTQSHPQPRSDPASWQIDQKSEKGVFCRGHQKAGTAGFTPHTMIDAARFGMDEIAGI